MSVPFYMHDDQQSGFRYDGTTWTRFGAPSSPGSGFNFASALAAQPAVSPTLVYAVSGADTLVRSNNGGATWTSQTTEDLSFNGLSNMWARTTDDLYVVNNTGDPEVSGIWHTLDGGATFTRMIAFPLDFSFHGGGGYMAIGEHKLFYAEAVSRTPVGGFDQYQWAFRRANMDGSGIETWATHTFTRQYLQEPYSIKLRACNDDFVLASALIRDTTALAPTMPLQGLLWKIDAAGITDVRPSAIQRPWELIPLTAAQWIAVGTSQTSNDVLVYRTTSAGSSWSLVTTIAAAQGFAANGIADVYCMLSVPRPTVPSEVVMLGHANGAVQHSVWISTDSGATWTRVMNPITPYPDLVGGLAMVCPAPPPLVSIPARLATIIG